MQLIIRWRRQLAPRTRKHRGILVCHPAHPAHPSLPNHSRNLKHVKLGCTSPLLQSQAPGAALGGRRLVGAGGDELPIQPAPRLLAGAGTAVVAVWSHAGGAVHVSRPPKVAHQPKGRLRCRVGGRAWVSWSAGEQVPNIWSAAGETFGLTRCKTPHPHPRTQNPEVSALPGSWTAA